MHVVFTRPVGDGHPRNKLAEAEVWFDADTPFHGIKLAGFSVWQSERGDRSVFVTFPNRPFGAGRDRAYFDYIRPQDDSTSIAGKEAIRRIKTWLLDEYRAWVERTTHAGERLEPPRSEPPGAKA